MLTALSVTASMIILVLVSFPIGYLLVNITGKRFSEIPFFVLFPLYIAVGFSAQIMMTYFVGIFTISPPITVVVTTVISIILIIFLKRDGTSGNFVLNYFRFLKSKLIQLKSLKLNSLKSLKVLPFFLIIFFFAYFSYIPIELSWPPIGDSIGHGMWTSMSIYQNHIPYYMEPLRPSHQSYYPTGFHVFSANISLLLNLFPGETIFVIGTFAMIIITLLLYTLSYTLTRSHLMSLPIPFSVFIIHQSGHMEYYLVGYLFNGVFVYMTGLTILFSIIILMQITYIQKKSIVNVLPIIVILLIALFFTYLPLGVHAAIFILACWTLKTGFREKINQIKYLVMNKSKKTNLNISQLENISLITKNEKMHLLVPTLRKNFHLIFSLCLVIIFTLLIVFSDVGAYYQNILSTNAVDYEKHVEKYTVFKALEKYFEDRLYVNILLLGIISSFLVIMLKERGLVLAIGFIALISVLLFDSPLLLAQRTITILFPISLVIIGYTVHELIPIKIKKNMILNYLVISVFVLSIFVISVPGLISITSEKPGWFLTNTSAVKDFQSNYDAALWLTDNVNPNELILNDESYTSLYLHSFSMFNLSASYYNLDKQDMKKELKKVWYDPTNEKQIIMLLKKHNVAYIVLMDEFGYANDKRLGNNGLPAYVPKHFKNSQYQVIFSNYDFLELKFKNGMALIYKVKLN